MIATTLRQRIYELLETTRGYASRTFNSLLLLLILTNVISVVVESVHSVYLQYQTQFFLFEVISVAIFTVEYLMRVWVAPENPDYAKTGSPRWAFARSGMAIVDILAIAPFYLGFLIGIDTRILRGLRLLRIFKLTRYSGAMELLVTVIKKELPNIGSALFVMTILIIIAASGIYVVERNVQPVEFGSIPAALWWATVTLTTVGYGDVVPLTMPGRVFAMLLMLTGVGMAALPAGILASGYSRELSLRKEKYETELHAALEDGQLSSEELEYLKVMRSQLGLSEDEAKTFLKYESSHLSHCPHCGKNL